MSSSTSSNFNVNDTIFHDLAQWFQKHDALATNVYSCPFTVLAVFRALPPLARLYIGRLLCLPSDQPVDLDQFAKSLRRRQRAKDRHDIAVSALRSLHVFAPAPHQNASVYADNNFITKLTGAITYDIQSIFNGPLHEYPSLTNEQMDDFSAERLENILNYVVESSGHRRPSDRILSSLVYTGILEQQRSSALCITSHGFHFLLKHSFSQLWILLRSLLLASFQEIPHHLTQAINLLFTLSFAQPGAAYPMHSLTEVQLDLLSELDELGLVFSAKNDQQIFYPTLVGVRLLSSANRIGADLSCSDLPNVTKTTGEIHIFVETNFRVYAYTTSNFQTNLLALFTHLRCKLPGLVVGHLTRDAVRSALMNGITAQQIIAYLNAHAHPRMKRGIIPSNVSDEILLWEAEQERVKLQPGVWLSDFSSQSSFERVFMYAANTLRCVLWHNSDRFQIIVEGHQYENLRQYIRENNLQ